MNKHDYIKKLDAKRADFEEKLRRESEVVNLLPEALNFDLLVVQTNFVNVICKVDHRWQVLAIAEANPGVVLTLAKSSCTTIQPYELLRDEYKRAADDPENTKSFDICPYVFESSQFEERVSWWHKLDNGMWLHFNVEIKHRETFPRWKGSYYHGEPSGAGTWELSGRVPHPPGVGTVRWASGSGPKVPSHFTVYTSCYDVGLEQFLGLDTGTGKEAE